MENAETKRCIEGEIAGKPFNCTFETMLFYFCNEVNKNSSFKITPTSFGWAIEQIHQPNPKVAEDEKEYFEMLANCWRRIE